MAVAAVGPVEPGRESGAIRSGRCGAGAPHSPGPAMRPLGQLLVLVLVAAGAVGGREATRDTLACSQVGWRRRHAGHHPPWHRHRPHPHLPPQGLACRLLGKCRRRRRHGPPAHPRRGAPHPRQPSIYPPPPRHRRAVRDGAAGAWPRAGPGSAAAGAGVALHRAHGLLALPGGTAAPDHRHRRPPPPCAIGHPRGRGWR